VDYRVSRGQKKTRVFKFETFCISQLHVACRSAVPVGVSQISDSVERGG